MDLPQGPRADAPILHYNRRRRSPREAGVTSCPPRMRAASHDALNVDKASIVVLGHATPKTSRA